MAKKGGQKGIPEEQVIGALRKHGARITHAAQELGILRQTLYERIEHSQVLRDEIKAIKEGFKDLGESHIHKGLETGDQRYVTYYMDRQARDRGYGAKVETEVKIHDEQLGVFIAAIGGDPEKLKAFRASLDPAYSPGPAPPGEQD